ncbi:hypothetical protein Slin14017_G022050 [Septoria linicola]|nr:hypothetical protein Slin14017_G022050 [Septoria linicola]
MRGLYATTGVDENWDQHMASALDYLQPRPDGKLWPKHIMNNDCASHSYGCRPEFLTDEERSEPGLMLDTNMETLYARCEDYERPTSEDTKLMWPKVPEIDWCGMH